MTRIRQAALSNPALPIAVYLGAVGLAGVLSGQGLTPDSIERALPPWLVYTWTWSLLLGGVLALLGCLAQKTRAESAGLALLMFGTGAYAAVVTVVVWPIGFTTGVAFLALLSTCGIRLRILALARRAEREAHHLNGGAA